MIHSILVLQSGEVLYDLAPTKIEELNPAWFWVDFESATPQEAQLLSTVFHFHPLAIEDCLHLLQRPKLDMYGNTAFMVLHALGEKSIRPKEVNAFLNKTFLVTYHQNANSIFHEIREELNHSVNLAEKDPGYILYKLIDRIVDQYFPVVYSFDEELGKMEATDLFKPNQRVMARVFTLRRELLFLRRTLFPQREVINRWMSLDENIWKLSNKPYVADIHDHLTRLLEHLDTYRELASNLLDNYLSLNQFRMNRVMMTLTVITTIFMPLTFIVGVYGMNFDNMPELHWKYGYFMVWGILILIAILMVQWFRKRGWFS